MTSAANKYLQLSWPLGRQRPSTVSGCLEYIRLVDYDCRYLEAGIIHSEASVARGDNLLRSASTIDERREERAWMKNFRLLRRSSRWDVQCLSPCRPRCLNHVASTSPRRAAHQIYLSLMTSHRKWCRFRTRGGIAILRLHATDCTGIERRQIGKQRLDASCAVGLGYTSPTIAVTSSQTIQRLGRSRYNLIFVAISIRLLTGAAGRRERQDNTVPSWPIHWTRHRHKHRSSPLRFVDDTIRSHLSRRRHHHVCIADGRLTTHHGTR